MTEYDRIVDSIHARVCALCMHADAVGSCSIGQRSNCAVERFLPQIVEVATTVNSDRIDDYVSALREIVCRVCRPDGQEHCGVRDATVCGLDRYFVLIIEAIEDVILKERRTSPLPASASHEHQQGKG